MEAAEETLTYRDDTGLHGKHNAGGEVHGTEAKRDESNYVDLDMKPDSAKTVKVSFTSNGSQLSVIKCDGSKRAEHEQGTKIISEDFAEEQPGDKRATVPGPDSGEPPLETLTKLSDQDSENDKQRQAELDPSDCSEVGRSESDELQYTDMYLNSKAESDDGVSAVLSDHCGSDTVEDESHYITTHEIQLTELDHDVDYDLGRGTYWDFEDDNLVYSFVDYASFESDDTQEGTLIPEGRSQAKAKAQSGLGGAAVSTEQEESDLCDSDKCASSDESVCKNQSANKGKFQLSIQTSSRAVNDALAVPEHFGDGSHFSFVSSGARAGPLCDRAQYFIPAPGRQHLATKLRRKDINEYSSGASSSISELDDADKEVRNLTAKSFRSLACPYFDAINLSTSSESSVSEYGLNKWSAYVDWNYGNVWRSGEQSVIAHKTSSATLEMKTVSNKRPGKSTSGTKAPQSKTHEAGKRTANQQASTSCKKIELKDPAQPKHRGVTLDLRCDVDGRPHCSKNACNEVTGTLLSRSGCEVHQHNADNTGDTHKRAIFASSLLKNVISKKMQFEQERKMERGEICDTHPPPPMCPHLKDQEELKEKSQARGSQQETACMEQSRTCSCEPTEEEKTRKATEVSEKEQSEPLILPLSSRRSSLLKEDDPEPGKDSEPSAAGEAQTTAKGGVDTSSLLFVPSCQLLSKRNDLTADSACNTAATAGPGGNRDTGSKGENQKVGKTPEIKICLRNVKENKGCTLNIANLLTPKISYNAMNALRPVDDAKWHILSATDKAPNFTVRDIRDTKCKFQSPIYHVRDVRKLVKSSYRFVSLDNSNGKCSTVAEKPKDKAKKEPVKHSPPSPIVIKCQSVKTNAKSEAAEAWEKQDDAETPHGDNASSHCMTGRVPAAASKQRHPDTVDVQQGPEAKLVKQKQEKFPCDAAERRPEPTLPKQAAIEKLKAAVKTMEQLYDFDRNEWKRKAHAPRPAAGSHVLSLIASEKQEATDADRDLSDKPQGGGGALNVTHVPYSREAVKTQAQPGQTLSNKSVLQFGNCSKTHVSISSVGNRGMQSASTANSSRTLVAPLSVKIEPPKRSQAERDKVKISPTPPAVAQGCSDYLAIPGLGYTNEIKLLNREPVSNEGASSLGPANNTCDRKTPEQKSSPLIMEYPATSIYHHPVARQHAQQQLLCFSPSIPAVSPTPSTGDTVQQTQRKMLLDPTTGHYYLVDTPIQATKRLFDPETGQYVDVPMPQSPVAPVTPVTPVTPVPLSLSPLAVSPGAFTPTYMIYPSFIPSPTLPAPVALPQSLGHSLDGGGEKVKNAKGLEMNTAGAESAYYSPTGEAPHGPVPPPAGVGHGTTRGGAARTERKPVISITTQQGPRIIAPPSFDGTTMSFVLEHR